MLNGKALLAMALMLTLGICSCSFGATVTQVAAGEYHTVALKSDGTVWAWGYNTYGQLGDGTNTNRITPVQVSGLSGVTAIAAGYYDTVALKSDGTVWAWGWNGYGQLGDGTATNRTTPVQVSGLSGVTAIAAGANHTVALKSDGTVWAWGSNGYGQLGDGTTTNRWTRVQVSGLSGVTAIAAGFYHTVALKSGGTVWAWGYNTYGQLGDGTNTQRTTPVQAHGPGNIGYLSGVTAIAASGYHTVALKNDSSVWDWGNNGAGQLGDGTVTNRNTPVQVSGLSGVTAIASGDFHTVALKSDGTAWDWGNNGNGQLGDGTNTQRTTPVQVHGPGDVGFLSGVTAIAGGGSHTVALKSDGTVWDWGLNLYGQLGDGTTTGRYTPVQVFGLSGFTAIAGGLYHTAALKCDGTVWAWGRNAYGALGDGTTTDRYAAVQVLGSGSIGYLTGVTAIAAGANHTVALKSDGTVWDWGSNGYGQLGNGTTTTTSTPVQVSGLTGVTAIAAGWGHTVALKSDGTVWAWGRNASGQLGDGTITQRTTPVQVHGPADVGFLSGVTAIASGLYHTMARKSDGTVWGWGDDGYGQLGLLVYNSWAAYPYQITVPTGFTATAIAAGSYHTVALKSDGTAWDWGYNASGQLGNNSTTDSVTPVQVSGLSGVAAIAGGYDHTVALKSDGTVRTWGANSSGQLGDGTTGDVHFRRTTSVQVLGYGGIGYLTGVVAVAAGGLHTVALKSDGTVWDWGYNGYGELGDGTTTQRNTPVQVTGMDVVPPTGSVRINSGAAYTTTAAVVLTLSAADDNGVIAGMRISNDGVFDTEPWESYATSKSWNLIAGEGTKTVYVRFKDLTGNESATMTATIIVDATPPNLVIAVSAGGSHTVALKADGTVWCWGYNALGQLGDGTYTDRHTPVQVSGLSGVVAIAAGGQHTVALKSDGTVWAWGYNGEGELGDGIITNSNVPVQVWGLWGVVAIAAGGQHTVALKADGTLRAWGYNYYGQLGDGTTTDRWAPVQVSSLTGVAAIAAGDSHTAALKTGGTMWCWGYNSYGQLGNGTTNNSSTPVSVSALSGVTAIAAGGQHTAARQSDGTMWCWGYNASGQLGDGNNTNSSTPVHVPGVGGVGFLTGVAAIAAGNQHTMALKSGGTIWCWGYNGGGQLGDGSFTDRSTPVQVLGPGSIGYLTGVTAVAAGMIHSVALKSDGTVWDWGYNGMGQLGNGTTNDSDVPVQVTGLDIVSPTGSVTIDDGATLTTTAAVTLTLSATDDSGTVAQMRISNDGVFDTELWEAYVPSKTWNLGTGDGTKTVYVRFKDPSGNESATMTATIILDTTPPSVNSVVASPPMVAAGDSVHVVVDATDLAGVSSITADAVTLTKTGPTTWAGDITAASVLGVHTVAVSAVDVLGHTTTNTTGSYKTAGIVGISGKCLADQIMTSASSKWLFKVWGKVTIIDSNSFYLDDGSGVSVRVIAPGYSGLTEGGYAAATGVRTTSDTVSGRAERITVLPL
jgi:alpha-tubulin suppressor-like RCC1 family protein